MSNPLRSNSAPADRPFLKRPLPKDRHFRPKLVGYNPNKPNLLAKILSYGALFLLMFSMIAAMFSTVPWIMRMEGSPLAVDGQFTTLGTVIYAITASVFSFLAIAVAALILILLLRKYLAVVQNRYGPVHNGPGGAFQTIADAFKLVSKEDFMPGDADPWVFTLAPVMVFVSAFLLMAVIPFGPDWVLADINVGLLFIVAAGTLGAYGVLVAGWSVNNKFSLLGGLRATAQLVSYEIPLSISLLTVGIWVGSLNLADIVEAQRTWWCFIPLFISAVVYLISSLAEIKMTPFDLPEAESELIAGFHTEYSGMRFGFFFVAEFAELFLLPAIAVVLFFGGYQQPFAFLFDFGPAIASIGADGSVINQFSRLLANSYGLFWFLAKTALVSWLFMWIRATLPRFRDDQLMELCWKVLIPLSIFGLFIAIILRLIFK